jgi:hypothetical protein
MSTIPQIEHFRAKDERLAFLQAEIFDETEIRVEDADSAKRIALLPNNRFSDGKVVRVSYGVFYISEFHFTLYFHLL